MRNMPRTRGLLLAAGLLMALPGTMAGQATGPEAPLVGRPGPDSPWLLAPAFFPRGALINFVEGDPHKAMPVRVDLALPGGYRMPAHLHQQAIHVKVLRGELAVGLGDRMDLKRARALTAGDTVTVAAGQLHYFASRGPETIVSITCVGPIRFTYAQPDQDPSRSRPFGP